ncbi:MAG TPA: penicillin-binding protein activator [Paracoccaceae bacterium]|nr:penicillin-binding protein activator [Paracoccaceae bacterium]
MLNLPAAVTRFLRPAGLAFLGLALAACTVAPAPDSRLPDRPRFLRPAEGPERPVDLSRPVTVALLLPLGSADLERNRLGTSFLNAAKLAQADLEGASLDLRVYETAGEAERARAAAARALAEGAAIIVGPLFGQEAQAVGPAAAEGGVNVLTFSTTPAVAGGNVFLLGQTADTEADRLIAYVRAQGLGSVAVFHPQSPSGQAAAQAVSAAAARRGLPLRTVMDYPRSFQGIQDRARDYAAVHAADGLVLPEGGQGLVSLAAFLSYYDVSPARTRFMGLGQWNSPITLREPALRGGWFVAPDPDLFAAFAARYRAAYGMEPTPIASLAYDGVAAVGALVAEARAEGDEYPFAIDRLTDPSGFVGVNGIFRFRRDGMIDRALAVMEVTPDGFRVLDPAPRSFPAAGI